MQGVQSRPRSQASPISRGLHRKSQRLKEFNFFTFILLINILFDLFLSWQESLLQNKTVSDKKVVLIIS